jgi:Gas vesicle synthesis protein GvpL/GvpF
VIELLAITDDPGAPPAPLRLVPAGPVGVLVAPAPEGEVDAEALWERESLLEDLMGERALLPIRYGTRVEDDAAAAAAVEPRGAELAAVLDRVRGAVEVSVRAVLREGAEAADVSAIHARLCGLAREHARLEGSEPLRAAYLVDRAAVDGFVAAVRELQHEHRGLSILCTGPWPPYSFAEPR